MSKDPYKVFVSHASADSWIALQIAACIREVGAQPFLDETHIPKGANFRQWVHDEIGCSHEMVALLTPSSVKRSWVWVEMGAAWGQGKPVVAVFYGVTIDDLEQNGQGRAILEDINVLSLNNFSAYADELKMRVQEFSR